MSDQFHHTVRSGDYEVTFHPAFASKIEVQPTGGTPSELYRQEGVYHHPAGQGHPKRHTVRLVGGPHGRDLTLRIDDPRSQVARITVEFYGSDHQPGYGKGGEPVERMTVENDTVECPPYCDDPTTRTVEADAAG